MNKSATINEAENPREVYFSSGVYDDGFEALARYLDNFASCKVCFLVAGANYLLYKPFIEKLSVQPVLLLSDDKATNRNMVEVGEVCYNCELIVCMDYISVNFCKKLQQKLKINCFYFFQTVPPVDAFLPYYYEFDGVNYSKVACRGAMRYIICYTQAKSIDKSTLIPCVCSLIAVYVCFLDEYINSYIFGTQLSANYVKNFALCTKQLSYLLKHIRIMPDDFVDNLYALVLFFAELVAEENMQSSAYCFASVYKFLKHDENSNFYESSMLFSQVLVHLYQDFFARFSSLDNCLGVSIQKKQQMHAKFFSNLDYNACMVPLDFREQMDYKLMRFRDKLYNKCTSFALIVDKLIDNALNLYADCGYALYKNFDRQNTLNALYFTPDFLSNSTLFTTLSYYGIFDNIKLKGKE